MSQRDVVLRLLRERGAKGVSAHELVYERGITRGAAVVFDLKAEGFDIETLPEAPLPDGRRQLARYVLHEDRPRPLPPPVADRFGDRPARPLPLPCGCVRSADGRSWERRCKSHSQAVGSPR